MAPVVPHVFLLSLAASLWNGHVTAHPASMYPSTQEELFQARGDVEDVGGACPSDVVTTTLTVYAAIASSGYASPLSSTFSNNPPVSSFPSASNFPPFPNASLSSVGLSSRVVFSPLPNSSVPESQLVTPASTAGGCTELAGSTGNIPSQTPCYSTAQHSSSSSIAPYFPTSSGISRSSSSSDTDQSFPASLDPGNAGPTGPSTPLATFPSSTTRISLKTGTVSVTIQSTTPTAAPGTTGTVLTSLQKYPQVSVWPTASLSVASALPTAGVNVTLTNTTGATCEMSSSSNIFQPVAGADNAPPSQIPMGQKHPVSPARIANPNSGPFQTNKFYANLFLGNASWPAWTHPYSVWWARGSGNSKSYGMAMAHVERSQLTFGPDTDHESVKYYINPVGIQSVVMSAKELGPSTAMTVDTLDAFSVNANFATTNGSTPLLTFPLVQGMGFVTGIYNRGTPQISSGVMFKAVVGPFQVDSSTYKYRLILEDGNTWLLYAVPASGSDYPKLNLVSNTQLQTNVTWSGTISIAKNNLGSDGEEIFDSSAGAYPTSVSISGTANGYTGSYTYSFTKKGLTQKTLLMFALPHHVQSFDSMTTDCKTDLTLVTTTKGNATAIIKDSWTMVENNLPVCMGFAPWSPNKGSITSVSSKVKSAVVSAAQTELAQNITAQTYIDSMYFSGKAFAKFASIVWATHQLGGNTTLAATGLKALKTEFAKFINNKQINPLNYDPTWKGVVSSAGYKDSGADFGNTYYNDHHFHYGYHVYTAAVIGSLDPTWLTNGTNKAWVDMLVRDFANPVKDSHFPFSRSFDWFHGHSWAKGLFESGDGKDQESSSEDAFASYAVKMWGKTTGDAAMEGRGNLMLAIQARSFQNYFLMESDNPNQPEQIINNKVTGILFENKVDWATYFGDEWFYKQGIHMIPVHVPSAYIRTPRFVQEEYDVYMSGGRIDSATGGWRGILYANTALVNASSAYNYFANPNFDMGLLDGGASRTWYLAFSAALGGA
ncbi:glycosyl hydrolase family 81-domain-containing protein [Phyllosticta capitalensis]|uniref:glucan endo-1,3-beta-D-glucosidase n=2 Tax=Phyllosticta capitalensis TaxID=121624 RepID=A0ABR1YRN5_9PEZI